MKVVKTFGHYVEQLSESQPAAAKWLLKTGWEAQNLKFQFLPDKQLFPADRYLAHLMMNTMLRPLQKPQESAIVSIFTPCELLQEAGLSPYNVESFSCYLAGSKAERGFLQQTENDGLSETLCSYHKTFIGAARKGILPKPKCIAYTNLICDANLLTFQYLSELFDVPAFAIDVPFEQNQENVQYVAEQLREMAGFLEKHTGRKIDESALKARVARSRRTLQNIHQYQCKRADYYIPSDLVTPLYSSMTAQILLGTPEEERYTKMLLRDIGTAPKAHGKRIYWMHTIPFWSDAVKKELQLNKNAQIVGCELLQTFDMEGRNFDPEKPYEALAERMVYHNLNGGVARRIAAGIRHAKETNADGAVWFGHWGCKHTLGASQLAKKKFEEAGIPLLILDGDACDRSHGGEGQTATRLGAFLEMLEENNE